MKLPQHMLDRLREIKPDLNSADVQIAVEQALQSIAKTPEMPPAAAIAYLAMAFFAEVVAIAPDGETIILPDITAEQVREAYPIAKAILDQTKVN